MRTALEISIAVWGSIPGLLLPTEMRPDVRAFTGRRLGKRTRTRYRKGA
jgi:hypothetical protein